MAIRTIHLDDDLNKELRKRRDVNWSAIAELAFITYLRGEDSADAIIERVKKDLDRLKTAIG